ncbi:hypothetical protein LCGC14_0719110 [marine sediment metagenome]|uniref:Uncharacterized protein n=1 Tax=marine sediment metagenome TaxID=412755 RepID=A0A0F9SYD3_9ZZZZ
MSRHISSLMNRPQPKTSVEPRSIIGTYHPPCPKCGLGIAGVQDDGSLVCFGCREDLFDDPRFAFRVQFVLTPDCPDGMYLVVDHDEEIARIGRDPSEGSGSFAFRGQAGSYPDIEAAWEALALPKTPPKGGLLYRPPKQPTKGD